MAHIPRLRRKRQFPGPAGILPDISPEEIIGLSKRSALSEEISVIIKTSFANNRNESAHAPSSQLSQNSQKSLFDDTPWMKLSALIAAEESQLAATRPEWQSISELMNIKWIQRKAHRLPKGNRIPFFMAVMSSVPEIPSTRLNQMKTQCVILQDKSGTIEAALDPDFVMKYGKELQPGTAFALRNVSELSVGLMILKGKLIVTITTKNVIFMASNTSNGSASRLRAELMKKSTSATAAMEPIVEIDEGAAVFHFAEFNPERIHEAYVKLCDSFGKRLADLNKSEMCPPKKISLFSTVPAAIPVWEDSQDINFDDDNEGDEFFSSIMFDDDELETDQGSFAGKACAAVPVAPTTSEPIKAPPCDTQVEVEEFPFEDDDEFDRILATCPDAQDTVQKPSDFSLPSTPDDDDDDIFKAIDSL